MKLKVYDGTPTPSDTLALRLIEIGPNEIMLAAVDGEGNCLLDPHSDAHAGGLLTIAGGRIVRSLRVMPSLDFHLDVDGRVTSDPALEAIITRRAQNFGGKRASFRAVEAPTGKDP